MTFNTRSNTMAMPIVQVRATSLAIAESDLPDGVCGRVTGIALRYNVVDSYGTLFRRGSLDKTRAKVNQRKVKLFDNHGTRDGYGTTTHVGTVNSLTMQGDDEHMSADLFDTEDGRRKKEYLSAVMRSKSETGLSIGFFERAGDFAKHHDGSHVYAFDEIELDEVSLAPRNAVPGADVLGIRNGRPIDRDAALALIRHLRLSMTPEQFTELLAVQDAPAATSDGAAGNTRSDDESSSAIVLATEEQRINAIRRSYAQRV